LLRSIDYLRPALDIPYCHHERWDGTGYPDRLAGDEIPLLARIVAVADAFDAMTSDRPYRKGLPIEEAFRRLRAGAGTEFDTDCIEALSRAFQTGKIQTQRGSAHTIVVS
ncbi:MAG TPA: HD domain-containing phosphohydrolase, partial [Herpetosiphonaceae bacterium]|nr:HD domain-containing phosphohydrolase [Herpetosiphonaceae bacterium]